eukprot:CAMPEP_0167746762 /NCGR_PEP_ID=MMETSP0110_2-20121227/3898_1 /TAXON_ID=629695 /ORGANISM="Gymnochlora sp., Strain CCMP2014" /LENGTH=313 /DNA_ID=CAMNT_0007631573 /DNA_START=459 /DNA_END=1397 /DNA_ORIENTATION=+
MSFGETLHRPALRTSERDRRCSQRANLQMSSILGIVLISVCALFIPNSSKRRLGYSPEPVVEGASRWSSERRTLPEHMLQRRGHKGFRPIFDSFTSAVGGGISGRPAYESTRDATRTGKAFAKAGGASGDAVSNKSTSRTTRGRPAGQRKPGRPKGSRPNPHVQKVSPFDIETGRIARKLLEANAKYYGKLFSELTDVRHQLVDGDSNLKKLEETLSHIRMEQRNIANYLSEITGRNFTLLRNRTIAPKSISSSPIQNTHITLSYPDQPTSPPPSTNMKIPPSPSHNVISTNEPDSDENKEDENSPVSDAWVW